MVTRRSQIKVGGFEMMVLSDVVVAWLWRGKLNWEVSMEQLTRTFTFLQQKHADTHAVVPHPVTTQGVLI